MPALIDLTGQLFGRLTVLGRVMPNTPAGKIRWRCQCLCGNVCIARGKDLSSKDTRSCGCLKREKDAERNLKHGHAIRGARTSEHNAWTAMWERCIQPNNHSYKDYGARGIMVDPAWRDFKQFLADMGPKPSPQLSLERRNNMQGYSPANCYWGTRSQQNRNTRRNVWLTWNNETHLVIDWEHILGFRRNTLASRLRYGWSLERAMTTPVRRR